MFAILLDAGRDRNGDPRRGYLVFAGNGHHAMRPIVCAPEDHSERGTLDAAFPGQYVSIATCIRVTASELAGWYRTLPANWNEHKRVERRRRKVGKL